MSGEEITQWKDAFRALVQQGNASLPAIQEFLRKNQDVDYGPSGPDSTGYSSARRALFDALRQIAGPQATGVALEALESTADPHEVALLTKVLDPQSSGEHRADVLAAARDSLAMAIRGELPGRDVGPLFEVFGRYGGQDVVGDLEAAAKQWPHYAAVALGQLPGEAGLPALVRMVNRPESPDVPALGVMAGLTIRSQGAGEAFLAQVAGNRIPPALWPYLSDALAGSTTGVGNSVFEDLSVRAASTDGKAVHLSASNENLWKGPSAEGLSTEQIQQQISRVERVLKLVGSEPAAAQAVQQTLAILARRLAESQTSLPVTRPGR